MLVSEWVQGHGTSCHLQVTAHVYVHAAKDIHVLAPSGLSLAATGVTGTLQLRNTACLVFILIAYLNEVLYIRLITGCLIQRFSIVCFILVVG